MDVFTSIIIVSSSTDIVHVGFTRMRIFFSIYDTPESKMGSSQSCADPERGGTGGSDSPHGK